nr:Chain E, strep-tag II peptide [synthetic construct]1KL3_F Chain F, strep-tag II peptide [synthetic construct]1KL3_G Chain G, strep-tag II peptide [synthetic construct]1KL3_H Chain H, strep-tag II peptide [synthetic construct]1KL5_E Chain E, strep-tag II [synthetic construct]1KL5_F Chain F, strep-tag II [synthetic construct]1KL5_G Chain G, strep-tag II [synthetic construct]1KL5_H Chain H, strep-tag II [synthetic construct]
NWSHPQFEK